MKIELSKEDVLAISQALDAVPACERTEAWFRANRFRDIASWPQAEYERNEREQSRVEHAGSKALYG